MNNKIFNLIVSKVLAAFRFNLDSRAFEYIYSIFLHFEFLFCYALERTCTCLQSKANAGYGVVVIVNRRDQFYRIDNHINNFKIFRI